MFIFTSTLVTSVSYAETNQSFDKKATFCIQGQSKITKQDYKPRYLCEYRTIRVAQTPSEEKHDINLGFCLSKSKKGHNFVVNQFLLQKFGEDQSEVYYKRKSSKQYYWGQDKRDIGVESFTTIGLYDEKEQGFASGWLTGDFTYDVHINKQTNKAKLYLPFSIYKPIFQDDVESIQLNCQKL